MFAIRWMATLCMAALALLIIPGIGVAENDEPTQYHYTYFKDPIPVGLDLERIAVYQVEIGATASPGHSNSLAELGIGPGDLQAHAQPGWSLAATPATARAGDSIEEMVAVLAQSPDLDFVSPVFEDPRGEPLWITRDLLIGFEDGVTALEADAFLETYVGGVLKERDFSGMPGVYRVESLSRNGFEVLSLANQLALMPEIKFAESNMIMTARGQDVPTDPHFWRQWGLHNYGQTLQPGYTCSNDKDMDCPEAWDTTTGDSSVYIVVLDDGVEQDHPDINQGTGYDFTGLGTGGGPYNQCDNHGTAVAGCVSAIKDNAIGVVGVCPDCMTRSAQFSTSNVPCDGGGTYYVANFTSALNWAQMIGARVTNLSAELGSSSTITTKYNSTYNSGNGILHFAASGNEHESTLPYPANLSSVAAVGGTTITGNKWYDANYGTGLEFAAPADFICTTDRTGADGYASGDYEWYTAGTSFASPYAAGMAGLLFSLQPTLTAAEVVQIMEDTAVDIYPSGYDVYTGWGFINADAALQTLACYDVDCDDGEYCNGEEVCVPDAGEPEGYRCDPGEEPCEAPCWICDEANDRCLAGGACCYADGSCAQMTEDGCLATAGLPQGTCTDCSSAGCEVSETWINCELSSPYGAPDSSVDMELFIESLDDVPPSLTGYQVQIAITRTSGTGSLTVDCSGCPVEPCGVRIDSDRTDYVFYGMSTFPSVNCPGMVILSSLLAGSVQLGSTPAYLGDFTFEVSSDATPGTQFEISVVTDPTYTYLRDPDSWPILYQLGPVCTLTIPSDDCYAPEVHTGGSKNVVATPFGIASQALLVAGDAGDPAVSCVSGYVQADGTIGATPVYQTPPEWGTVNIHGEEIIPSATYWVQAECPAKPPAEWPAPVSMTTWAYGDVASPPDGEVNIQDILGIIAGYQQGYEVRADIHPCVPDGVNGIGDILTDIDIYQGATYADKCPAPCPP